MPFKPGDAKPAGSGRQRGTPNRTTRAIREALFEAFEELGGTQYLVELGRNDPAAFVRLLTRLVPNEVATEMGRDEVIHRIHIGRTPTSGRVTLSEKA
jgi:hypothetical protein